MKNRTPKQQEDVHILELDTEAIRACLLDAHAKVSEEDHERGARALRFFLSRYQNNVGVAVRLLTYFLAVRHHDQAAACYSAFQFTRHLVGHLVEEQEDENHAKALAVFNENPRQAIRHTIEHSFIEPCLHSSSTLLLEFNGGTPQGHQRIKETMELLPGLSGLDLFEAGGNDFLRCLQDSLHFTNCCAVGLVKVCGERSGIKP